MQNTKIIPDVSEQGKLPCPSRESNRYCAVVHPVAQSWHPLRYSNSKEGEEQNRDKK
jgi:hypothetical protein